MEQVRPESEKTLLSAFEKYLEDAQIAPSSRRNYVQFVKFILKNVAPPDRRDPQQLLYFRGAHGRSYPALMSAWRQFQLFHAREEGPLPAIPDLRKIRYGHPVSPDAARILGTMQFYNGLPATLTWERFLGMGLDQPTQMAALRLYQFFCNDEQPRGDQPIIPRSAESTSPMPKYVLESIANSNIMPIRNRTQLTYRHINGLLAGKGAKASLSTYLYRCFVVSSAKIARRADSSHDELIEYLELRILSQDLRGFVQGVREWCDNPSDEQLLAVHFE
jgi:hypothetical protein